MKTLNKKMLLLSLLGLVCGSENSFAACQTAPDCATLGYTMTAAECSGLQTLKCPFDTSKLFCIKTREETPKTKECDSIGDILYTAGNCAFDVNNPDKSLKPVGVVFDVSKRLAVRRPPLGSKIITWGNAGSDIPELSNCSSETCLSNANGQQNTAIIIAYGQKIGEEYPAAQFCFDYAPANCDKAWCGKGQWFLPSLSEMKTIFHNRTIINTSLKNLNYNQITDGSYWTSSECNASTAYIWGGTADRQAGTCYPKEQNYGDVSHYPVLAVVKY